MPIGSQNDFWQMGVALPVQNRSFREGKVRHTRLYASAVVGATSIQLWYLTEPANIRNWLQVGDLLTLGPSTSSSNPGATETVVVTAVPAVGSRTVNIQAITGSGGLLFDYDGHASDETVASPLIGIGTSSAAGWKLTVEQADAAYGGGQSGGIFGPVVASYGDTRYGADDDYFAQTWYHYFGSGTTSASSRLQQVLTGWNGPIWGGNYRVGCYYKYAPFSSPSSASLDLVLTLGSTSTSTADYTLNLASGTSSVTSWTRTEGVLDATAIGGLCDYAAIAQKITLGSQYIQASIDHVWAEHAIGIGQTDAGYVTFTEHPVQGSFGYEQRRAKSSSRSFDNHLAYSATADSQGIFRKWEIECEFAGVNQAMWDMLQDLERYQDRGHLLSLHTFINDLPWVLVGTMDLGKVRKSTQARHNFSFQFREA